MADIYVVRHDDQLGHPVVVEAVLMYEHSPTEYMVNYKDPNILCDASTIGIVKKHDCFCTLIDALEQTERRLRSELVEAEEQFFSAKRALSSFLDQIKRSDDGEGQDEGIS